MILYLTSQQHTNLLDFLTEQTDALPIKKMTGNFMLKQFTSYITPTSSHHPVPTTCFLRLPQY